MMSKVHTKRIGNRLYNTKSQQILQAFHKEFFSWSAENIGQWFATGFMELGLGVFLIIPYQEMIQDDGNMFKMLPFFAMMGAMWYLMPYIQFREEKKMCKVYDKLKYLPISLRDIKIFRLRKLTWFCLRLFFVFFIGQLFFALVVYHEIIWGNIWYPTVFGLLIPLVSGTVFVGLSK